MKKPRFEVIQTLIRGKQSVREVESLSGGVRVIRHKKPVGYVLKDLEDGKKKVVTDLEAVVLVIQYGATNVMVTATYKKDGRISPYIRSKKGLNLQAKEMVSDPVEYVDKNKDVVISEDMQGLIQRYRYLDSLQKNKGVKYSDRELLQSALELMELRRKELRDEGKDRAGVR